jgi:lysosomal acid lipase/cholesteryl ester hydrolase
LDSADCWIINYANVAPAFVAHNAGYDIWLGNSRGNKYSMEHTSYNVKKEDYWQFDWEDMGDKDIPAAIDFVTS